MKGIFISAAALALSVFASPVAAEASIAVRNAQVEQPAFTAVKRKLTTVEGLIDAMNQSTDKIKVISVSIDSTLNNIKGGTVTEEAGNQAAADDLKKLAYELAGIDSEVNTAAFTATNIPVSKAQTQDLLDAVKALVTLVLTTVEGVVTCPGLARPLTAILFKVFITLNNLFAHLVLAIGDSINPGLIAILEPFLDGILGPALATFLSDFVGGVSL